MQTQEECTQMVQGGCARVGVCGPQGWGVECRSVGEAIEGLLMERCESGGKVGGVVEVWV